MLLHEAGRGAAALLQNQRASIDASGRRAFRDRREVGPDHGLPAQEERGDEQEDQGHETEAAPVLEGFS
jgi:hypothetical protein